MTASSSVMTDLIAYNFNVENSDIVSRLNPLLHDLVGQTFMHELARENDVLSAEALMGSGCGIDTADDEGRRPLHEAAFFGSAEMVKFLTKHGALMDAPIHPFGYTALYYAVQQGHANIVRLLVDRGARLDVEDRLNGQGLLHLAASNGDMIVAGQLIAAGIDVFREDKKGQTARDLAARYNNAALENVLLKVMQHHARN